MNRDWLLNAAVVVTTACALVVTGLLVRRELFAPPPAADPLAPTTFRDWQEVAAEGQRSGPAGARVTVVEFSDFQCPYCRAFHERLAEVRRRYPDDVAVVYRHFPVPSHPHAVTAALASECAASQGRWQAYHDVLFARQQEIGVRSWTDFARQARVPDIRTFEACVAERRFAHRLAADSAAAVKVGVTGTPTVLINDRRFGGALSTEALERYVRDAL